MHLNVDLCVILSAARVRRRALGNDAIFGLLQSKFTFSLVAALSIERIFVFFNVHDYVAVVFLLKEIWLATIVKAEDALFIGPVSAFMIFHFLESSHILLLTLSRLGNEADIFEWRNFSLVAMNFLGEGLVELEKLIVAAGLGTL